MFFSNWIFDLNRFKKILLFIAFIIGNGSFTYIISQDPVFTQFYNAPLQINPAFAGNTYAPMVHLNTRLEWPAIGLAYNTYSFSVDRFFHDYNFGSGLLITMDNSGNGIYKRFRAEGVFSYRLKIRDKRYMKMGLSLAYGQNTLDWQKLVFGDEIDPRYGYVLPDGTKLPTGEVQPDDLTVGYLDISAGILFYSKELYFGIAVKHANTPVDYYNNKQNTVNAGLPVRVTAQIGGEFDMFPNYGGERKYYTPSLLFAGQSGLYQIVFDNHIDLGAIFAGIGYRWNIVNSDAVLFSVGMSKEMFKISYSFDYTVSKLGIGSGGSHEVGVSINFDKSTLFKAPYRYSDCFNMFR